MVEGDYVVCIDNKSQNRYLTLNKVYKVIEFDEETDGGSYVGIMDDYGELYHYRSDRFKLDIRYDRRYKLKRLKSISDG